MTNKTEACFQVPAEAEPQRSQHGPFIGTGCRLWRQQPCAHAPRQAELFLLPAESLAGADGNDQEADHRRLWPEHQGNLDPERFGPIPASVSK